MLDSIRIDPPRPALFGAAVERFRAWDVLRRRGRRIPDTADLHHPRRRVVDRGRMGHQQRRRLHHVQPTRLGALGRLPLRRRVPPGAVDNPRRSRHRTQRAARMGRRDRPDGRSLSTATGARRSNAPPPPSSSTATPRSPRSAAGSTTTEACRTTRRERSRRCGSSTSTARSSSSTREREPTNRPPPTPNSSPHATRSASTRNEPPGSPRPDESTATTATTTALEVTPAPINGREQGPASPAIAEPVGQIVWSLKQGEPA